MMLKGFLNLFTCYTSKTSGKVIDIGCGQSPYTIDLLGTNFEVYAVDEEPDQIKLLKKRVDNLPFDLGKNINYFCEEFTSETCKGVNFDGAILSNILHFYKFKKAKAIIEDVECKITTGSIIVIIVHSKKHISNNGKKTIFGHFYNKNDLEKLFLKSNYDHLYFSDTECLPCINYEKFYLKYLKRIWIRNGWIPVHNHIRDYYSNQLLNNRQNYLTLVVSKK